jgi:hypothetical protein
MLKHLAEYKQLKASYRKSKALLTSQKHAIIQLQEKMRLTEAKERHQVAFPPAAPARALERKRRSHYQSEETLDDRTRKGIEAMSLSSESLRSVSTGSAVSGSATSGSVERGFESDDFMGALEEGSDSD